MGCFLACFGASKERRRRRPGIRTPARDGIPESYKPLQPSLSPKRPTLGVTVDPLPELREKNEEGSISGARKKVTFDLNVKTIAEVPAEDQEKKEADEVAKPQKEEAKASLSTGVFPPNHRYQNCDTSDGEEGEARDNDDEEDCEDSDFDEDDGVLIGGGEEEESYESFFSLPMEKDEENFKEVSSPKVVNASFPDIEPIVSTDQNVRDRSQYVHSVLNPVENLSQWREVKVCAKLTRHANKENIDSEQEPKPGFSFEPTFMIQKPQKLHDCNQSSKDSAKQEVSVDASLSSWLVTPPASQSYQSNSSLSREEQPILGALTIEDLKQSVTSSPRRSPSRSPDEIPIVGTVGTYWSLKNQGCDPGSSRSGSDVKGIPNSTSKYREDRRVNWHSTPFEVRLERALNKGAAEACLP